MLRKDLPSPLAKESDEEGARPEGRERMTKEPKDAEGREGRSSRDRLTAPHGGGAPADAAHADDARSASTWTTSSSASSTCRFRPATCRNLQAGNAGQLYFIREIDDKPTLQRFDLEKRKPETVLADVADYRLSADAQEAALPLAGRLVHRADDEGGEGRRGQDRDRPIEVKVDPRAEWTQIFDEAWRINRDYFYDPDMHGADWKAARDEVRARSCPTSTTRSDLNRVMQWMLERAGASGITA